MKKLNLPKLIYRFKRTIGCEEFKLYVDVAPCNLKCMMCPRGGVDGLQNDAKGLMDFDLFKKIIDKFKREGVRIKEFEVGNWGEPLLNPELPKMIRYLVKTWKPTYGSLPGTIGLSTNLTYLKDPAELLECGINRIRASI